jgi:hypothetical protein
MKGAFNRDDKRCRELLHLWYEDKITNEQLIIESEKMIIKQKKLFY